MTTAHELKTWTGQFDAVWNGIKTYEIRVNDRGFAEGHHLFLREWDNDRNEYTGRSIVASITYMTEGGTWGLPVSLCVLGIGHLHFSDPAQTDSATPEDG